MRVVFKITRRLLGGVLVDLRRAHTFAAERVGWLRCRVADSSTAVLVLAHDYVPVEDGDYVEDPSVGARMSSAAIRKALQLALNTKVAMFHVHLHDHRGGTRFSRVDAVEAAKFVPDFWHVRPDMPHGALVFSRDWAVGRCWCPGGKVVDIDEIVVVGAPLSRFMESHGQTAGAPELPRRT
jgi:hypothetical protein